MWSRMPLVRLIFPFIAGILFAPLQYQYAHLILLWMSASLIILGGVFFGSLFSYRNKWLYGIFIIVFIFVSASVFTSRMKMQQQHQLSVFSALEHVYLARLDNPFEMGERSCRGKMSILAVRENDCWRNLNAVVMVYTEKDSSLLLLESGKYVFINAKIEAVRPPSNPGEFDYKEYLARKGIVHSTYLKKGSWFLSACRDDFELLQFAINVRKRLLNKLSDNGIAGKHFGISSALLLGEDAHLDANVRDIYARVGAMHILCVSGLHVGVIYLVLASVFGFLKRFGPGRFIFPVLLMSCIWLYALITGLAAPVVRASCMISFIIIGNSIGRQKNVYNTLAASAFLMLMIDPFLIYAAGFQLSYAAVLGIVSLQKPLNDLFYFKYSLPDRIWSITAVSIAAQIATLPVVMYYFHQFPLYGLLSNLIVIPLSSLIIYTGIFLLFLPAMSTFATAVAWLFYHLIDLMDTGVGFVEKITYGLVEGIYIDIWMALLLAAAIFCLCVFLLRRNKSFLFIGLSAILFLSAYRLHSNLRIEKQESFIVYSVRGHSAYDMIKGREHIFLADSALLQSESKLEYSIHPNWLKCGLNGAEITILQAEDSFHKEHGTCKWIKSTSERILVWQGRFPELKLPVNKLRLDVLILRGRCPFEMEEVFTFFELDMVVW